MIHPAAAPMQAEPLPQGGGARSQVIRDVFGFRHMVYHSETLRIPP